jgi:hypothetical protein
VTVTEADTGNGTNGNGTDDTGNGGMMAGLDPTIVLVLVIVAAAAAYTVTQG